jgi:hypothetical protein
MGVARRAGDVAIVCTLTFRVTAKGGYRRQRHFTKSGIWPMACMANT